MGLEDVGYSGSSFTWYNGQKLNGIWARLDRVLFNGNWSISCPSISVQHLSRACSDHSPLLVSACSLAHPFPSRLCFQQMWISHKRFLQDSRDAWNAAPMSSFPLLSMVLKLRHMKSFYKDWNKNVFKNVFDNVLVAEEAFLTAQVEFDNDPSDVN